MKKLGIIKNRLLCAAIFLATLAFVLFYGGIVPYTLFYTALALITASLVYFLIMYSFCEVRCVLDRSDVIKGGDVLLTIEIKNKSPLFIPYANITYKNTIAFIFKAHDESISVAPFSGKRLRIVLTSKYRGRYDVNIPEIRLMDFLGIVNVVVKYAKVPDVLVYPHIDEIDEFSAVGKFDLDNQMNPDNISEDITAISDVREYMNGDGMKKIHWNLSARMMSFMSKNYENISKSRLIMLINLSRITGCSDEQRLNLEDRIVETAVSIIFHFLNKFWNVTLCYYEKEYFTYSLNDAGMFGMAYDHLAFVEFSSAYNIARIFENISQDTAGGHLNLCIVTHEVSDDLIDAIIRYSKLGSRIALIYVCKSKNGLEKENWVKAARKSAVSLFFLDLESNLHSALAS